ncbi:MAG: hypothetical protein ACI8SE_001377, partial [Bacteroidia bacterium]
MAKKKKMNSFGDLGGLVFSTDPDRVALEEETFIE